MPTQPHCWSCISVRHGLWGYVFTLRKTVNGSRETHNSYSYSHHDYSHSHHVHPHSPNYSHQHRRGVPETPQTVLLFQYFNLCKRRHTLLKKTSRNAPIIQGTRETHNSYTYTHHDYAQSHHVHPQTPNKAHQHRRGVDTSRQGYYHL